MEITGPLEIRMGKDRGVYLDGKPLPVTNLTLMMDAGQTDRVTMIVVDRHIKFVGEGAADQGSNVISGYLLSSREFHEYQRYRQALEAFQDRAQAQLTQDLINEIRGSYLRDGRA